MSGAEIVTVAAIAGCVVAFAGEWIAIHIGTYIRNVKARKR